MLGLDELQLEGFEVESVRGVLRSPMTTRNKIPTEGLEDGHCGWMNADELGYGNRGLQNARLFCCTSEEKCLMILEGRIRVMYFG